jgi:hypothetical protein
MLSPNAGWAECGSCVVAAGKSPLRRFTTVSEHHRPAFATTTTVEVSEVQFGVNQGSSSDQVSS